MNESGELTKIKIVAYKDKEVKNSKAGEWVFPINPENFSHSQGIKIDQTQAPGSYGTSGRYTGNSPEQVKIDFWLDNTGTIMGNELNGTEVSDQIAQLKSVVSIPDGSIHSTKFLKLIYGKFVFDCRLSNLSINYTLFKPSGAPLRAKGSASFVSFIEDEKRVAKENKSSPDLTHSRRIKPEENITSLTYSIYGTDRLYLQVAKANNITNFRKLRVGGQIIFPPIKKDE